MIEVVFSDSEKGAMQVARHARTGGMESGGQALGDVAGLSFQLDMGDIAGSVMDESRREFIAGMFRADPYGELSELDESIRQFWDSCTADLETLRTRARAGEPVRIWFSHAPYSLCGLYDTLYQLKDCDCRITAIKLPDYEPAGENGVVEAVSWGEIEPERFAGHLPLESEIPKAVRHVMALKWAALKQENAPLRAVLNGRLHSVGEDFYDTFVRGEIPEGPFRTAELIGAVLGRHRLGIGDWLIAGRIRRMIETGELRMVQKNPAFYRSILEKSGR